MTDVDRQLARSSALLQRSSASYRQGMMRQQRSQSIGKRLTRIAIADGAILALAIGVGLIMPIGQIGAFLVMIALMATTVALALLPANPVPTPTQLRQAPLATLPAQTGRWLETQRAALPAPAISLIDQIGIRLDTLSPQLATLDEDAPAAAEVRKLVGEQLPEFLKGYAQVPAELRAIERNGKTPDAQLLDGLTLIEREIREMTEQLAEGALDGLATRGRFLEIKYRGDGNES